VPVKLRPQAAAVKIFPRAWVPKPAVQLGTSTVRAWLLSHCGVPKTNS